MRCCGGRSNRYEAAPGPTVRANASGMTVLLLLPVWLSLLTLSAHFLRAGSSVLVVLPLAVAAALVVPRWWVARVAQAALVLGALEWLSTLVDLAARRAAAGEPYLRMALIVVAVAVVTGCSALLFESGHLRGRYGLAERGGGSV